MSDSTDALPYVPLEPYTGNDASCYSFVALAKLIKFRDYHDGW